MDRCYPTPGVSPDVDLDSLPISPAYDPSATADPTGGRGNAAMQDDLRSQDPSGTIADGLGATGFALGAPGQVNAAVEGHEALLGTAEAAAEDVPGFGVLASMGAGTAELGSGILDGDRDKEVEGGLEVAGGLASAGLGAAAWPVELMPAGWRGGTMAGDALADGDAETLGMFDDARGQPETAGQKWLDHAQGNADYVTDVTGSPTLGEISGVSTRYGTLPELAAADSLGEADLLAHDAFDLVDPAAE